MILILPITLYERPLIPDGPTENRVSVFAPTVRLILAQGVTLGTRILVKFQP